MIKCNKTFKQIKKQIKIYNNIFIARHIGADPDALGSTIALRDLIKEKYPNKSVYAIGNPANRFKFMGNLDKVENIPKNSLLIVLDTPDSKRIDGIDINEFDFIIKIDHHPFIEKYANIEYIDDTASSTCQIILEFIYTCHYKLNKSIAEKLYLGIASDTNRFLYDYTTVKTFELVTKMLKETKINFTSLYESLYCKPLNEVKLQGYIYQNMTVTENGVAYIKITDALIKEFGIDSASAGNMINNLNYVNEILVWIFLSEDVKSNVIRANIRSRGPVINEVASRYGGGGHKFASGARLADWDLADKLISSLDELTKKYLEK
jgi:phosphoesterase RecJ-like protein